MAEQFLSVLRRSCRFDKKRFARDIQRFHPHSVQPASLSSSVPHSYAHAHDFDLSSVLEQRHEHEHSAKKQKVDAQSELQEEEEQQQQQQQATEGEDDGEDEDDSGEERSDQEEGEEDEADEQRDFFSPPPPPPPPSSSSSSISLFSDSAAALTAAGADEAREDSAASSEARALKRFRKERAIHVSGSDVPPPILSFTSLVSSHGLPSHVLNNLTQPPPYGLGFDDPTPIQMQAMPVMLAGRECVGCSPTGTGKSAAFLLPIVLSLLPPSASSPSPRPSSSSSSPGPSGHYLGIRSLVVAPTKELAAQLQRVCSKLLQGRRSRVLLLTKANSNAATFASAHDVVIATPLRLLRLLKAVDVDVSALHHVVLDEADRLLDLGFLPQLDHILALLRAKQRTRQFLLHLFSATLPHSLDALLPSLLFSPIRVTIAHRNTAQPAVQQRLVYVGDERGKLLAFRAMRSEGLAVPMLVFVQSGSRARQLHALLHGEGLRGVAAIHGELSSAQRSAVLLAFRVGEVSVLITTDLLSRGMDFVSVACVLNWDFPQSTTSYIHRIGRTARGGRSGLSLTLFTATDRALLRNVAGVMRWSGGEVPAWMLGLHGVTPRKGRQLRERAPAREPILPRTKEEKEQHEKQRIKTERKAKKRAEKKKRQQRQPELDSGAVGEEEKSAAPPPLAANTGAKKHGKSVPSDHSAQKRVTKRRERSPAEPPRRTARVMLGKRKQRTSV